jgi:MoxR-like ATPase
LEPDRPVPTPRLVEDVDTETIAPGPPPVRELPVEPYLLSKGLCDAVNLAIALGRPLLVQGDPGVGKTRLAYAVAYHLGLPLEQAYIRSTSKGRDLLYTFDAVRRLSDAQLGGLQQHRLAEPEEYVRLGPLGRAIVRAEFGRRSVLLIDEIDKADLDFPNDLLRELDELRFQVDEVPGMRHSVPLDRPDLRPIIIVTNNEEKALPGAFLRRCVFHYVGFPDTPEHLDAILGLHGVDDEALRTRVIEVLLRLRGLDLTRKPGLSELLDWAGYLHAVGADPATVHELPHLGALVKQHSDEVRVMERLRRS